MTENPINELIIIPPEEYGDLELSILHLKVSNHIVELGSLPPFEGLSENLTVGRIEQFGASLFDETKNDSEGKERGGWVHLDIPNNQLLLPKIPTVGVKKYELGSGFWDHGSFSHSVTPPQYITDGLQPVVFDHSHPSPGAFSDIDVELVIGERQNNNPVIAFAHTQGLNYMLHRSQETRFVSWKECLEKFHGYKVSFISESEDLGSREYHAVLADTDGSVFNAILDNLNGSSQDFFLELMTIQAMAEEFKLGFYYSKRDGIYKRFSFDRIRELIEGLLTQSISKGA